MAKQQQPSENPISRVDPALTLPAYMKDKPVEGTESMTKYVVPPRIKIIQKSAAQELLAVYNPGDVIIVPHKAVVALNQKSGPPTSFRFVPLFFWPEWATWTPLDKRGQMPSILYRTTDDKDPIASKAKSPTLRSEEINVPGHGAVRVRHVEHLNFVISLVDHPLSSEIIVLSYARGEHQAGSRFAGLIRMRKSSIYGGIFEGKVGNRKNAKGDWWGLDVSNPSDGPAWVSEEDMERFRALHLDLAKLHAGRQLRAEYEDPEIPEDPAATPAGKDVM